MMQGLKIVLICVLTAVAYGIVHDQITARICVEYFTIGHPPIFDTDSPTLLGLGWGIIATWWVGLILGIALALAARFGRAPKRTIKALSQPILLLIVVMASCAALAGLAGCVAARNGWVFLTEPLASEVPKAHHTGFLVDLWTHLASYGAGFVGGAVVIINTWRSRKQEYQS